MDRTRVYFDDRFTGDDYPDFPNQTSAEWLSADVRLAPHGLEVKLSETEYVVFPWHTIVKVAATGKLLQPWSM